MISRKNGLLTVGVLFEVAAAVMYLSNILGDTTTSGATIFLILGIVFIAVSQQAK